jgi:Thrombospondin type 3 repeat
MPAWRRVIVSPSRASVLLLSGLNSSSSATSVAWITDAHLALPQPGKARIVLPMSWRRALFAVLAVAVCVLPGRALANTVHYVLTAESRLTLFCQGCIPNPVTSEPISGSFDVTEMPVPADYAVDAVTGLHLQSASHTIAGSGFLQRLGTDRMAMVVKGSLDGLSVLLTSGRRQPARSGEIRMQLTSPKGAPTRLRLTIVARPAAAAGHDADGDNVVDEIDNCPQAANPAQADADADGTGDACDQCADTPLSDTVVSDGCSLGQQCPCDGPSEGREWESQRDYVQCVARQLKVLRQTRHLGKSELRLLLQDAVRSGCGRRVIASL